MEHTSTELVPARVSSPGCIVRREREARGQTQKEIGQITLEIALELAAAFGTSAELWLNLEANYRLHKR